MTPTVELLAIGTELILGRVQDTNSHWICQRIMELGGNLRRVTMLTDDEADIIAAVRESVLRGTDVIVTMGGLGPTPDDRTVATIAGLLGRSCSVHEPTVQHYMVRRGLAGRSEVSAGLLKMATVMSGAEVAHNPEGWAPCIRVTVSDTERMKLSPPGGSLTFARKPDASDQIIFILPGPPRELTSLFSLVVEPYLRGLFRSHSVAERIFVDAFESEIAPLLHELMEKYPRTYLKGMIARKQDDPDRGLPIDIVAAGDDASDAKITMNRLLDEMTQRLWSMGKTFRRE